MTIFLCARCSIELTPDLTRLRGIPEVADDYGRERGQHLAASTVPQGTYAIEPEPWGAPFIDSRDRENPVPCQPRGLAWLAPGGYLVSAGPRNTVVIHPDDAPLLRPLPGFKNSSGCCGPGGTRGPNRACPCGTVVATLAADCLGPFELHLDPMRMFPLN